MTDALANAGPDRRSVWLDGRVGLGHALLRTSPESDAEQQPSSLDGEIRITAAARVDGRAELIHELCAGGRDVGRDTPDDELILHAYHVWGENCVAHLIGDFAFAIWDGRRERLFCARDQFGVTPFFYAAIPGGLIFSNVLNSLRVHPAVTDRLNERAIGDFLLFHMNMDVATTTFTDIAALPPAHTLTWADGHLSVRRYWDLPPHDPGPYGRPAEYVERFGAVFDRAVGDRLRAGAAGTHLSGGMDSTSIAATAAKLLRARGGAFDLRAYTIVYDHLVDEAEGRFVDEVAAAIGIAVEHLVAEEFMTQAPRATPEWVFPEPTAIPNQIAEHEITRRVSTFSRALLVGFGGDPLFTTGSVADPIVTPARVSDVARSMLLTLRLDRRLPRLGVRTALRKRSGEPRSAPGGLPDWIDPGFARRNDLAERFREVVARHDSDVEPMLSPLWVNIFTWSYPGSSGFPVKLLFPFFDLRLVRCVRDAPPFACRQNKRLLRESMRGVLPEAVRRRPKTPLYVGRPDGDTSAPLHQLALDPAIQRWRRDSIATPGLSRYIDVDRALALVQSPSPRRSAQLDACFPLADWLRSQPQPPRSERVQPPDGASPGAG
jgi:asparagine synthase (glutamine-hydrolysing)